MAVVFTKGLVVGVLLLLSLTLIFLSVHNTRSVPNASIITQNWKRVVPETVVHSDPDWLNNEYKTVGEFFKYLHWTNGESCELPMDFGGHIHKTSKFVGMDGQKTLCLDNGVAPDPKSCVIYSFGINNEWSFDDRMAEYGCNVFAFDPSMKVSDHDRSEKIKFFRTGLGTENVDKDGRGWKMRTFSTLKRELGSDVIDILKIDIEGDEWGVLKQLLDEGALEKVKQLAVEIHIKEREVKEEHVGQFLDVLRNIERAGFVRFSSKGNPWLRYTIPSIGTTEILGYEVAWFNRNFKA